MLTTEEQIKNYISKREGVAHKHQIARDLKISLDYADLVCRGLERRGEINFSYGLCSFPALSERVARNEEVANTNEPTDFPGMTNELKQKLEKYGYITIESLAHAPLVRFIQETGLEERKAAGLINHAKQMTGKIIMEKI